MSAIPPDILGSAAQAGYTARQTARAGDAERSSQAREANRNIDAADDAAESVETSDGDTAVFADAEGAGGQGREAPTGDEDHAATRAGDQPDPPAGHLDIRA